MSESARMVRFPSPDAKRAAALSTSRVVFLVISAAAPLTAMVGNMPLALRMPGSLGMPVSFLIVAAILACFAVGYTGMTREITSSGAFYTYIGRGLGKTAGVVSAYFAIVAYGGYSIGLGAAFGYFASLLFAQLGLQVSWIPCSLGGVAIIGMLGYRSLDLSARMLAFFMVAEFAILAAFDLCVLAAKGADAFPMAVWRSGSLWTLNIGAMIPFAIVSFVGFESGALYGEESMDPRRSIPRATFASLAVISAFYMLTVWIMIGAAGPFEVSALAQAEGGNMFFTLADRFGGPLLVSLCGAFFVTSLLAAFLALHCATSRYMWALAHDGLLPSTLEHVHPRHRSPDHASLTMTAVELVLGVGLGLLGVDPYLGIASGAIGLGTIGIIVMQMVCAFAVVRYYSRAGDKATLRTLVLPLLGGLGLAACLALTVLNYGGLTGSNEPMVTWLPLAFLPLIGCAVAYAAWLKRYRPAVFAKVASSRRRPTTVRGAPRPSAYRGRYCIVGAGPNGLLAARAFLEEGIPFDCFERHSRVGGIWDPDSAGSPMYESAHFISSKWTSYFYGFPMPEHFPDYPSHRQILEYIEDFASTYGLTPHVTFNTSVVSAEPAGAKWRVTLSTGETRVYDGVVAAPGVTWHPSVPSIPGMESFKGEVRHSNTYRSPEELRGKSVLVVGAGNSGVDIACDAARSARRAFFSVRRGYRFVPKHIFGVPTDVLLTGQAMPPKGAAVTTDANAMLDALNGDLTRLGLPKPDHDALASHPIMNTEILSRLAHGDIVAKPDVAAFDGHDVVFKDGSREATDLVLLATGYSYGLPFLDPALIEWMHGRPQLYLNVIHRELDGFYVLGFAEFADAGYRRFDEMAQLVVADINARETGVNRDLMDSLRRSDFPDLRGGKAYVNSPRHANYVDSWTYQQVLSELRHRLGWPDLDDRSFGALRRRAAGAVPTAGAPPRHDEPARSVAAMPAAAD